MSIHDGHRERTLECFYEHGFERLQEHQKLEIILFFSIPRADTNEVAHALIKKYHTVAGVMDAPVKELLEFKHITMRTVQLFKMIKDTHRLYEKEKAEEKSYMTTTAEFYLYLRLFMQERKEECFVALYLDDTGRFLKSAVISRGELRSVDFNSQRLLTVAWECRATTIVIAHNHPNNDKYPSAEDIAVTQQINALLRGVGIYLKDHIIITDDDYYSFFENERLD